MPATKYAMANKIPREWSPGTAETIEKEFERIYKATQIAASQESGTTFTNGLDGLSPSAGDLIAGIAGGQFELLPIVTTDQRVLTNNGDIPTWAQVDLAAGVTGKLPLANIVDFSATKRLWGRNSSGSGVAEEVTASQLLDWLGSTDGNILYRDGSAWVVLAPGTSAQVLLGGTPPSWGTLTQNLTIAQVTLNNAQLQTLNATPVTLVSAPGSGNVIVPVMAHYKGVRSGTAFTGDAAIRIQWNSISFVAFTASFTWNSGVAATLFRQPTYNTSGFTGSTSDDPRNKAVELVGSSGMTGGSNNSCTVTLAYYIATGL